MAMVQPKSQKLRLFTTHLLLLIFIAAIMFPLLMVIAISLREGTLASGVRLQRRTRRWPRHAAAVPGPAVAVELD